MPRFTVSLHTGSAERRAELTLRSTDTGGAGISHGITIVQAGGMGIMRSLVVTPDATLILHNQASDSDNIRVVSNVPWRATENIAWITSVRPSSGTAGTTTVTIAWTENTNTEARAGKITFMSNEPGETNVLTDVVNVSQRGGIPSPFVRVREPDRVNAHQMRGRIRL